MNYDRFDKAHEPSADPCAWMAYAFWLIAWGIIASIAIIETFTNWLD